MLRAVLDLEATLEDEADLGLCLSLGLAESLVISVWIGMVSFRLSLTILWFALAMLDSNLYGRGSCMILHVITNLNNNKRRVFTV